MRRTNLKEALEMGIECGLETVGECLDNVEIHGGSLFKFEDWDTEVESLCNEIISRNISFDDNAKDILRKLNQG